jgi:hypothetical protein
MIRKNQKCYQKWLNLLKPIIHSKKIKLKKMKVHNHYWKDKVLLNLVKLI